MKRIGLIAEFNPFHNGHKLYIDEARKAFPSAQIIVAMSGNVVQRGEFSIVDKFSRTKAAIECGVDLVVEIPSYYTLNNANLFAKGAVDLLNSFGVDTIVFGSESGDYMKINNVVNKMQEQDFEEKMQLATKKMQSYPKAFESVVGEEFKSNDILGIAYSDYIVKSGYNIMPYVIKRDSSFISASKNRMMIKSNEDTSMYSPMKIDSFVDMNEFYDQVKYKLVTEDSDDNLITYLKNKVEVGCYNNWDELIERTANKTFTKARLSRELLKWFIGIKEEPISYRVLGASVSGFSILKYSSNYVTGFNPNSKNEEKIAKILDIKYPGSFSKELKTSVIKKED